MNLHPDLWPSSIGTNERNAPRSAALLAEHASLIRRRLGCHTVAIRIVAPLRHLFSASWQGHEVPVRPHGPRRVDDALCVLAHDPAAPKLPSVARDDLRRLTEPTVASDMGFAFYAGLPLRLASGDLLGSLAALDVKPRRLAPDELAALQAFAASIVRHAEARLASPGVGG